MMKQTFGSEFPTWEPDVDVEEERPEPKQLDLNNSKDREEAMRILRLQALVDHPDLAQFHTSTPDRRVSNVFTDDQGHALPRESVLGGTKATAEHQTEYLRALRAEIYKRNGVTTEDPYRPSRPKGYKF